MFSKQGITFSQLREEGFSSQEIKNLSASLKLFPTPFKGIYYVPGPEERKAWFIDKPLLTLRKILQLFLGTERFYFSCRTAEEFWGVKWQPLGEVHVVNAKRSGKVDLRIRVKRNENKRTYRAKKIATILSFYGNVIIFHKVKSIEGAKLKYTPYGTFAMKGQLKKDKKRFREKSD